MTMTLKENNGKDNNSGNEYEMAMEITMKIK